MPSNWMLAVAYEGAFIMHILRCRLHMVRPCTREEFGLFLAKHQDVRVATMKATTSRFKQEYFTNGKT